MWGVLVYQTFGTSKPYAHYSPTGSATGSWPEDYGVWDSDVPGTGAFASGTYYVLVVADTDGDGSLETTKDTVAAYAGNPITITAGAMSTANLTYP